MRLQPLEGPMLLENSNAHNNLRSSGVGTLGSDGNSNHSTTNIKYTTFNNHRSSQWAPWSTQQKTELVTNLIFRAESPPAQVASPLQSPVESPADYEDEGQDSCSSCEDLSPDGSESDYEETSTLPSRGIVNPNYPGFQHFASQLHSPQEDVFNNNNNNNNNNNDEDFLFEEYDKEIVDSVNKLDVETSLQKAAIYAKPKLNIPLEENEEKKAAQIESDKLLQELNLLGSEVKEINSPVGMASSPAAVLDSVKEHLPPPTVKESSLLTRLDTNRASEEKADDLEEGTEEKVRRENLEVARKKEKMEINLSVQKSAVVQQPPANLHSQLPPANMQANSQQRSRRTKKSDHSGGFDVYNIETAMPKIDLDAIESHLRAAREEERRRRNDREEIRRRLATGSDNDEYYGGDRPGRKPSLQARLQSGMNLQICFMNETMSDTESPCSEVAPPASTPTQPKPKTIQEPPRTLNLTHKITPLTLESQTGNEGSFFERQARLQAEARMALSQAKDLARMQMQAERQRHQTSPITDMLRASLQKVGIAFPEGRRRVSRQMLTDMNVAQLQVIVNDLHTQIEYLNEGLVKFLMERDELHMSQDSMLVDIEDLTRYLGAKENLIKEEMTQNNNMTPMKPPMISRIVSLGKK